MKKIIIDFTFVLLLGSLFIGCEKGNQMKGGISQAPTWASYDWVASATSDCFINIVMNEDSTLDKNLMLSNYFDSLFMAKGFSMPAVHDTTEAEMFFYRKISNLILTYSLGNETLVDSIYSLQYRPTYIALDNDAKVRVGVFAQTIMGLSSAISSYQNGGTKQPPRIYYNSSNGNSQVERQLSSCMSYQLDGHFETWVGTIVYLAGLPESALVDVGICTEEIIRGYWNHVK